MNLDRPFQLGSWFQASAPGRPALGFALVVTTVQGLVVALSIAGPHDGGRVEEWRKRRESFQRIPEELDHLDRFRAVRGRVVDESGKPIASAHVRSVRLDVLVNLGDSRGDLGFLKALPVEAETLTDAQGRYEFPHLSVGSRTFFFAAAGQNLAPVVKDMIVVQDGLGALLDVTLEKSRSLTVRLGPAMKRPATLHLIPHRWVLAFPTAPVGPGDSAVVFRGLGGPSRRALIAVSGPEPGSLLLCVGRYDLDRSGAVFVSGKPAPTTRGDLPEALGVAPSDKSDLATERAFYTALSPVVLLWADRNVHRVSFLERPRRYASFSETPGTLSATLLKTAPKAALATDSARGFGPYAFLPVLLESRAGGSRIAWSSDASGFACEGLPAGPCLVRGFDVLGRLTFARGLYVAPGTESSLAPGIGTKLDLDEPDSREVSGFVRWENGAPAVKAEVYVQNAGDFRRYLHGLETDENGFDRGGGVPADETSFLFTMPPGDTTAIRQFAYSTAPGALREITRDATLHPHRIAGALGDLDPETTLRLSAIDATGERIVRSTRADASGRFLVTNVAHGRYRVDAVGADQKVVARSEILEIGDGRLEAGVEWSRR